MEKTPAYYPKSEWRIILGEPRSGAINMAIDAAILAAVEREEVPPTLRLFRWDPPCLSLGYSQPYSDINEEQLFSKGWDVVRRPTGGRAILHTDELTYSVIGPRTEPRLEGGLMQSYRRLSEALSASIQNLGLTVEVHTGKNPQALDQPVCFENPSEFEITVDGKKIIGNAQARKKEGILQHGTLPLTGDLTRITEVLHYGTPGEKNQAAEQLLQKAATVETLLGKKVSWDEAAQAFKTGFQETLNVKFTESDLTTKEEEQAAMLEKTQFGSINWTRQI
jgi:lipoate-protein ligase A